MCTNVSIPGRTLNTTPHIMYGLTTKMPFGVLYNDLSLTYLCSDDMYQRHIFDGWHAFIVDMDYHYWNFFDDYAGKIDIKKYTVDNVLKYHSTVEDCFPISVEEQALAYETETPLKITVHFAYRRWTTEVGLFGGTMPAI
jgi:hypothetical protein